MISFIGQNLWSKSFVSCAKATCSITKDGYQLNEGDSIDLNGKLYKVEDCELNRAYHACGTHILFIINIVCRTIEHHQILPPPKKRVSRFVKQKLLTEACCQSVCTVSEMSRYCP